ncbi:translocation/assembly module TamB [Terracidiphilus gabretensis]|uniref:translocation/assembly module TamB n=1 Tax=Terracidiphilus gabretensis TaxID=1577687 RepID=UPI00071B419D|nr:translocation/assembly module TamB [Terracidiphilus gabretensis]
MTEQTPPPVPSPQPAPHPAPKGKPRKRRRMLWAFGIVALLLCACGIGLNWWIHSSRFEQLVRQRIETTLATATGARVEMGAFRWSLSNLEADADNIILHGNEPASEAPYARIDHLHVGISILNVFSPRILLREAIVERPQVHLIVYPDQTTNQPHPRPQPRSSHSGLDTFFDLQANHVAVEQGMIHLDIRADTLDVQARYQPLDFEADDASLVMQYVPARDGSTESYHIDAGIANLSLARGKQRTPAQVQGLLQASIDLTRKAAYLRSLRLTAHARGAKDQTLQVTGSIENFAHPHWQAQIAGEVDLRLLDPILGYPNAREGIAHLNLSSSGTDSKFRIDGPVHVEHATYIAPNINARDIDLNTHVHADNSELHCSQVAVRPRQGGEIDGDVDLQHWLPVTPVVAIVEAEKKPSKRSSVFSPFSKKQAVPSLPNPQSHDTLVKLPVPLLPVDGKVTANFNSVTLDTVLDLVGNGPFQRLGLGAVFNGPAEAVWSNGDVNTLKIHAALTAHVPSQIPAGEVPTNGVIDAVFTQRTGGVDINTLTLTMPSSHLEAHGHIGAFPLSSPTSVKVDVQSHNISDFDAVLRDLGLNREGKTGSAALPVALHGQAEFHMLWTGSLISPRLAGNLKATQISIEIPATGNDPSAQPRWIAWDEIDADGNYDAENILITHSHLRRGSSQVSIEGTIAAAAALPPILPSPTRANHQKHGPVVRGKYGVDEAPSFSNNSLLHANVHATQVSLADLLPLTGLDIPVTGTLDAQIQADGTLGSPGGSGWAQLTNAVAYGEPISHARAQGSLENHIVHLSSLTAQSPVGAVNASGSYDLNAKRFDVEAHGNNLDLAHVQYLHSLSSDMQGKLTFTATASGTPDDPRVEGHAELAGIMFEGKTLGSAQLTAHTVNREVGYDLTSRSETVDLQLHGQTELHGDFATQAQAQFSHFNLGAALKLARVEGISAESSIAGTANVSGPLRYPNQMHGELRLDQAAFAVSEVQLHTEGPLHATLENNRVHLDQAHIVGDQTDLRAEATLDLKNDRKLDLTANGSVNLKLAETLDKDITANGTVTFQVEGHGPLANPQLRGSINFQDGSLSLEDIPNGLSHIRGSLEFNQNRLEVRSLTAMTGGGQLSLGGYLAYQHGIYADLNVTGKNIRIRYPEGVSSLADTTLRLQGTQRNLALTGNVLITRFTISQDLDIATLAAQANAPPSIAPPDAPSNHIRLDVRIQTSPQLNFQNAYAKLAGDADLRLLGTLASPSLIGRISVTEGSAMLAGTRYTLQRGEITFSNPIRIQPVLDLNATARVEDYDITLGLHGTLDKLSVNYRSDPPLPESDVVALLAVGRTQSEQGLYTAQQQSANSSTDILLGGALNATMSSRVQKLFGAGSVKVDPSYLGALGNSTTRITVEEQLGRYVTLTYATNVDTSAEQLIQADISINRHVSVLVQRDESGVFSMVLKNTRRYR